jgi:hypothetical protein
MSIGLMLYEQIDNVIDWANQRDLIDMRRVEAQTIKLFEEAGEVAAGVAKDRPDLFIDGIGDMLVVMIILGENFRRRYPELGIDEGDFFEHCLGKAWEQIKDRQGKTVNGIFIKQGD